MSPSVETEPGAALRFRARTLGLAALVTTLVLAACGATARTDPVGQKASGRVGSLVVSVPSGFHERLIRGREDLLGVLVTDYGVKPGSPTLRSGIFPAGGVALSVARGIAPAVARGTIVARSRFPRLQLPLRLARLRRTSHADGTVWNGVFASHARLYDFTLWLGRVAPRPDRVAALRAFSSIRLTH